MQLYTAVVAVIALLVCVSHSTIQINVGQHGLHYEPQNIDINSGDTVQFNFYNNHTVMQSSSSTPCEPLSNGFYSGIIPASLNHVAPEKFILSINDGQPIYFYCSISRHCQAGMVGGINVAAADLVAYADKAETSTPDASAEMPPGPVGGVISTITATSAVTEASPHPSPSSNANASSHETSSSQSIASSSAKSSQAFSTSSEAVISSSSVTTAASSTTASTSIATIIKTIPPSSSISATTVETPTSSTSTTATTTSASAAVSWDSGKALEIAFGVFVGVVVVLMSNSREIMYGLLI